MNIIASKQSVNGYFHKKWDKQQIMMMIIITITITTASIIIFPTALQLYYIAKRKCE